MPLRPARCRQLLRSAYRQSFIRYQPLSSRYIPSFVTNPSNTFNAFTSARTFATAWEDEELKNYEYGQDDHNKYGNPYANLGVSKYASPAQIKTAYYRIAKRIRPDTNKDPNALKEWMRADYSYDLLQNPVKRRICDRYYGDLEALQRKQAEEAALVRKQAEEAKKAQKAKLPADIKLPYGYKILPDQESLNRQRQGGQKQKETQKPKQEKHPESVKVPSENQTPRRSRAKPSASDILARRAKQYSASRPLVWEKPKTKREIEKEQEAEAKEKKRQAHIAYQKVSIVMTGTFFLLVFMGQYGWLSFIDGWIDGFKEWFLMLADDDEEEDEDEEEKADTEELKSTFHYEDDKEVEEAGNREILKASREKWSSK